MKIIIGQGNPGTQYAMSRHNVGFLALDAIAAAHNTAFILKTKLKAEIAEYTKDGEKVLLVKPTTFYNETGQATRLVADFYKVDPANDVLAIHDDLALPLGTLRIRERGSDAGNNGIKSLNTHLGQDYRRIRVGVYNDLRDRVNDVHFVLGSFTKAESDLLTKDIIPKVIELADQFCSDTLAVTSYKV